MKLDFGTLVHDADFQKWVYVGYRTTSVGSQDHHFVRCLLGSKQIAGPLWTYHASNVDTLRRKFIDLEMKIERA